ncbi:proprotein convertase P-domain-containing protein, partial [Akkermansiaceae bacterium]|nr:proprotein convertase P-domain-containing protein [Akkermansiaceae bacterium]
AGVMPPRDTPIVRSLFTGTEAIPDGDTSGIIKVFDLSGDPNMRIEHVEIDLNVITLRKADLSIKLISPSGTESILSESQDDNDEQSISGYVFSTTRNWGEGSAGQWILRISDERENDIHALFNDVTLTINGVLDDDAPISEGPVLISASSLLVNQGDSIDYIIESLNVTSIAVGELPLGLVFDDTDNSVRGVAGEAGIFAIPITLTGPTGVTNVSVTIIVRPIAGALGQAVEQNLPTFSGGDVPWDLETTRTLDGVDAVRSGAGLRDGEDSVFGFNGIPDGVVVFDWSVSSQAFSAANTDNLTGLPVRSDDRLWFNFGGAIPQNWAAFIDGERTFGREILPRGTVAVPMTQGSNTPRWTYRKDGQFTEGQDSGYVDKVRFIDTKDYMDDVRRAANLNFDVEFNSKTWWIPFQFPLGSPPTDDAAGPRELLRSSGVGNGQTVSMSAWLEGPGTLSYDVSVSTENNDVFEFVLDGAPRNTIGGTLGITTFTQDIAEGTHYVEFKYRKDFILDGGNDLVFLDDVTFTPISTTASWAAGFGVDLSDVNGDFDLDGFSNIQEYAFGGNPTVRDIPANIPRIVKDGSGTFLEFGVDLELSDMTLTAQESSNLEDWQESTNAVMDRKVGNVEIYRIPVGQAAGNDHLYYRVIATPK